MAAQVPEFASLRARVATPERPLLREVDAAIAGITDPREAWEVLATRGLIPAEWLATPSRLFTTGRECPRCAALRGDRQCAACGRGELAPETVDAQPVSIAAVRALACNPAAITTAEALAGEALARLPPEAPAWPYRATGPAPGITVSRMVWTVFSARDLAEIARSVLAAMRQPLRAPRALIQTRQRVAAGAPYAYRGGTYRSIVNALPADTPPVVRLAAHDVDLATWWKRVEDSAREPDPNAAEQPRGRPRPVDPAVNPFLPLLEVWALGFVPLDVHRDACFLIAPDPAE